MRKAEMGCVSCTAISSLRMVVVIFLHLRLADQAKFSSQAFPKALSVLSSLAILV